MLIKMNHVTHLSDARYGAGMGVKWMGVQCAPGDSYLSVNDFSSLSSWVVGPEFVAEISNFSLSQARSWLKTSYTTYGLSTIEISDKKLLTDLPDKVPFFYRKKIKTIEDLKKVETLSRPPKQYVLSLDEDWPRLRREVLSFAKTYSVLLHAPLSLSEVSSLRGKVTGLALDSTPESRPGWQDYGFLAEILELLNEE